MKRELEVNDCPVLLRGVRVHNDKARNQRVLLVPEKAIALDAIGEAILARVNGVSTIEEITQDLAKSYQAEADVIRSDVMDFLNALRKKLYLGVTT